MKQHFAGAIIIVVISGFILSAKCQHRHHFTKSNISADARRNHDLALLCRHSKSILAHPQEYDVIIVGAGIAGLVAAKTLLEIGIGNFKVLEARDRLGGRYLTVTSDEGYLDLGPEVVPSSNIDNFLHFAATQKKLDDFPPSYLDQLFFTQDGSRLNKELFDDVESILTSIRYRREASLEQSSTCKKLIETAFKQRIDNADSSVMKTVFDFFLRSAAVTFGDDLANCNVESLLRNVTSTRNPYIRERIRQYHVKDGVGQLVQMLGRKVMSSQSLNRGVRVSFNAQVKKVYWQVNCSEEPLMNQFVFVRLRTGAVLRGRHILLTLPLGVLKQSPSSAISFIPPLPKAKADAIKRIGFGCFSTIFLQFQSQFWPESTNGIWLIWRSDLNKIKLKNQISKKYRNSDDKNWYKYAVGFRKSNTQNNTLQIWIYAKWALVVEYLPDDEIGNVLIELLNISLSRHAKENDDFKEISPLKRMIRSKWCSDPHVLGTNAYLGVSTSPKDFETLAEPLPSRANPRLTFAGEATHEALYGTTEGAWRSAVREAERLAGSFGLRPRLLKTQSSVGSSKNKRKTKSSNACLKRSNNIWIFVLAIICLK